jgi:hypothetical protein
MGLQTAQAHRVSRVERSEGETGTLRRTDDWLRELFSGTYDLREADARRRLQQRGRLTLRKETPRDER